MKQEAKGTTKKLLKKKKMGSIYYIYKSYTDQQAQKKSQWKL